MTLPATIPAARRSAEHPPDWIGNKDRGNGQMQAYNSSATSISLLVLTLVWITAASATGTPGWISMTEAKPVSELWVNPGFYSYHFDKDKGFNNDNFGIGAEYRYTTTSAAMLGIFDNSDRQTSRYAGWLWQPLASGPVRIGAVVGAIDGYPHMLNGGWFAAVIPTVSYEYRRLGANLLIVPSYQNRLYGAISLQLKLKVF